MRFHPLTRFVRAAEDGSLYVEARVEFSDREGDISKALGQLAIRLLDLNSADGQERIVAQWDIDLNEPAENREHYEEITRTYFARLDFDEPPSLGTELELRAVCQTRDGRTLQAHILLAP